MAFTTALGFKEDCTILLYDGANASNSIYRHRFLPGLAEIVPSVVPCALDLYAREPQKLVEDLPMFTTLVIYSRVLHLVFWPHCTRALTFPRWGKRRDQWRAVMYCEELLASLSVADMAGSLQTTSSPGVSTA